MNTPTPPEIPRRDPQSQPQPPAASGERGGSAYDVFADKVGGVPNLRPMDNLFQGVAILVCLALGIGIGWMVEHSQEGLLFGGLAGLVGGVLLSGAVLMVRGLMRKS